MPVPPIAPFADVEHLIIAFLTDTPLVEYRAVTQLPYGFVPPPTVIRVSRTSGANRSIYVDRPIIDIDVFSGDYADASDTARVVQALLLGLRGTVAADGYVQNVTTVIGPRWLPDPNQDIVRFGASYEFHAHS